MSRVHAKFVVQAYIVALFEKCRKDLTLKQLCICVSKILHVFTD